VSAFLQRPWEARGDLHWRLTGLVIALLIVAFSAVGAVQHLVLRQYLLGHSARAAGAEASATGKLWQGDRNAMYGVAGSPFAIYGKGGQVLISMPVTRGGKQAPVPWVEPPRQSLAAARVAFDNPTKQKAPGQPLDGVVQHLGLGPMAGPGWNQQVVSGPTGDVMLTIEPVSGGRLLVMETPLAEVDAVMEADLVIFSLAAAAALVTIAALAIWLTARSLAPLGRLSAVASQIKDGAYDRRTGLRGKDQVAKLAMVFDEMVDRLQEQIVREREAEARTRRFLADASHELRNPMAALLGHVGVLRRGAATSPADLERSLSATHAAAQRMSKLLNDLLEIARLEQSEHAFRTDRVEMATLVRQAARSASVSTGHHLLQLDLETPLAPVLGDREALERVIVNLLDNAARYSPPGTSIALCARSAPEGWVEVSVIDQGPGISPEEQERIFERLYRGDHACQTPGTGLGLAISRTVARRHGGDVLVVSRPGKGSTFVLRLPAASPHRR
jgi:two-component system OmpR family sensor kinase